MKYYFDPSFNVVNKNRYANLIKYLFLHYDQFVTEVVGENFEESVYRNLLYPSAKYKYWIHRRHRAYKYQRARRLGKSYKVKELISFADFERDFKPPVAVADMACLQLFIRGLEKIIAHNSIVHDQNGRCFKLEGNGPYLFISVISTIIAERFPNLDHSHNDGPFNCCAYTATASIHVPEYIPVYMFIFKLLKKKKLDFRYETISSEVFSQFMDVVAENLAEIKIKEILSSDVQSTLDDDDIERAIYNREESNKHVELNRMLKKMDLPDIVEAYFNVYGTLPAGYLD